jgi:hypothetical protein
LLAVEGVKVEVEDVAAVAFDKSVALRQPASFVDAQDTEGTAAGYVPVEGNEGAVALDQVTF